MATDGLGTLVTFPPEIRGLIFECYYRDLYLSNDYNRLHEFNRGLRNVSTAISAEADRAKRAAAPVGKLICRLSPMVEPWQWPIKQKSRCSFSFRNTSHWNTLEATGQPVEDLTHLIQLGAPNIARKVTNLRLYFNTSETWRYDRLIGSETYSQGGAELRKDRLSTYAFLGAAVNLRRIVVDVHGPCNKNHEVAHHDDLTIGCFLVSCFEHGRGTDELAVIWDQNDEDDLRRAERMIRREMDYARTKKFGYKVLYNKRGKSYFATAICGRLQEDGSGSSEPEFWPFAITFGRGPRVAARSRR